MLLSSRFKLFAFIKKLFFFFVLRYLDSKTNLFSLVLIFFLFHLVFKPLILELLMSLLKQLIVFVLPLFEL